MNKLVFILVITLLFGVNLAEAKNKFDNKCGQLQPELKKDKKKFKKAKKCKNDIDLKWTKEPMEISNLPLMVEVVHLASTCDDFKINDENWVILADELRQVYKQKPGEFTLLENRLEKLIGVPADDYKCLIILNIPRDLLRKPEKKDNNPKFPFTGKGFTCDWYYGDGCRYGLSEFILNVKTDSSVINTRNYVFENNFNKEVEDYLTQEFEVKNDK